MTAAPQQPAAAPAPAPPAPATEARHRRGWRWWLACAGIVVAGLVVLVVLLWPATTWWVDHVDGVDLHEKNPETGREVLEGKDRQEILDKARGRITTVATGVLAAAAIYYTASNARSARQAAQAAQENVRAAFHAAQVSDEAQRRTFELTQQGLRQSEHAQRQIEEAQRRTHELTERGQLTDRFTAAVAQLGDTNPAIQLGGVHALAGIADDADHTMRQTCIDVLCAFLRLPYDPDPGELAHDQIADLDEAALSAHNKRRAAYRGLREVRHTIIRLIGNHLRPGSPHTWQGHDFDFTGVVFDGGDLHRAHFSNGTTTFHNATFTADFNFWQARFSGGQVNFGYAKFTGGEVNFGFANFSGGSVNFRSVLFSGGQVNFEHASFSGRDVDFGSSLFAGGQVNFGSASFAGHVDLRYAFFSGSEVNFEHAKFSSGRVNCRHAAFSSGGVNFRYAKFTGGEVDFSDPLKWDRPPQGIVGDDGVAPEGVIWPELT